MTALDDSAGMPLLSTANVQSARAGVLTQNKQTGIWVGVTAVLVVGYLAAGRSFAYLGFPWLSIYVGELALAAFLILGPAMNYSSWLGIAWRTPSLRRLKLLLLVSLGYGAFEVLRGIRSGYPVFTAARDIAFHYYPIFLFLGIWAGLRDREFLRRVMRAFAWVNGCYGLAYALVLSQVPLTMPGTSDAVSSAVPLFSEPLGSAIALLGLLAFEPKPLRVWHLLTLNAMVMLFVQMRAEWLGFFLGLLVFAWCTKRLKHIAIGASLLAGLLGGMYVAKIDLPSPEGRGGQISTAAIVARAVAPVNEDLAHDLAPEKDVAGYTGTTAFRLVWWAEIWSKLHMSLSSALLGFGYGYPIGDLNPFIEPGEFIRTPHNDFFYVLGYSGWVGVAIFVFFQAELLRLLVRSYRITHQPFGLMCWVALITESMFGDFLESPMGAIPFFLLIGAALAPGILSAHRRTEGELLRQPLPVTRPTGA
jgi:hypothetical protein